MPNTHYAERLILLCWATVMTALSTWFTLRTLYSAYLTYQQQRNEVSRANSASQSLSNLPHSPRIKTKSQNNNGIKSVLLCTALSSISFTMSLLVWMSVYMVLMWRVYWKDHNANAREIADYQGRVFVNLLLYFAIPPVLQLTGYSTLLMVTFLRLISVYKMNPRSILVFRSMYATNLCLIASALFSWLFLPFFVPIVLLSPVFLSYPWMVGWVSYSFFNETRKLSGQISEKSALGTSMDILDSGVRLTIVSWVAVISTVLVSLVWVVWLIYPDGFVMNHLLGFLMMWDVTVNVFCLLCFMVRINQGYYDCVFGILHSWMLSRLIPSSLMK